MIDHGFALSRRERDCFIVGPVEFQLRCRQPNETIDHAAVRRPQERERRRASTARPASPSRASELGSGVDVALRLSN